MEAVRLRDRPREPGRLPLPPRDVAVPEHVSAPAPAALRPPAGSSPHAHTRGRRRTLPGYRRNNRAPFARGVDVGQVRDRRRLAFSRRFG